MKHLKKLLALALIATTVFTATVSTYAEDNGDGIMTQEIEAPRIDAYSINP